MKKDKKRYFTLTELCILSMTLLFILGSFLIFDGENYLTLIASLLGGVALILCAKGNPLGQILIIVFSLLYGCISFSCAYYGEMITYVCMTMPMAVFSLISWLKNPYKGNKSEVAVRRLTRLDIYLMIILTLGVTVSFYFILKAFNTAKLSLSTLSVATSFAAVYLTFKRTPFYAVAYALNDIVLICLWISATLKDVSYISVLVCFIVFLVNDIYGFISWRKMYKRQRAFLDASV